MNKKVLGLLCILAFLIAVLTTAVLTKKNPPALPPSPSGASTSPAPSVPIQPGEYEGTIVCLPKKGEGPHTLECAVGLHTPDNKYYALKNAKLGGIATDTKVAIQGTLAPASPNSTYDIAGEIDVQAVRELQ